MSDFKSNDACQSPKISISVIVPLSKKENCWKALIPSLLLLPKNSEIIFIRPASFSVEELTYLLPLKEKYHFNAQVCEFESRACQMNQGAQAAKNEFLWFLHADSHFCVHSLKTLLKNISKDPLALHYFKIKFLQPAPLLCALNSWAANLRSKYLLMPFGDQGFCLQKKIFLQVGSFDELCSFGEDHLFIWKIKKAGFKLCCTDTFLGTSSRKYSESSWLKVTAKHILLTMNQALPQCFYLIKSKLFGR